MLSSFKLHHACIALRSGGVIAYPTEAVYGLGCDPLDEHAVRRLLAIKHRSAQRGVILVAADFAQLSPFVAPVDASLLDQALASWPGPNTWLFPAAENTPRWLTGRHQTIAIRVSAHPLVQQLCKAAGMALVSTSCNREKHRPARTALEAQLKCPQVDVIVNGAVDFKARPSVIRDLKSGTVIRS
jgi:L-threonylcarbamoyladenylate synthase